MAYSNKRINGITQKLYIIKEKILKEALTTYCLLATLRHKEGFFEVLAKLKISSIKQTMKNIRGIC